MNLLGLAANALNRLADKFNHWVAPVTGQPLSLLDLETEQEHPTKPFVESMRKRIFKEPSDVCLYVVEDNEFDIELMETELKKVAKVICLDIRYFTTAEAAISVMEESPPCCLFLNLRLPKDHMQGEEFYRLVKKKWPAIPVVIVSGLGSDYLDNLYHGSWMTKPFPAKAIGLSFLEHQLIDEEEYDQIAKI